MVLGIQEVGKVGRSWRRPSHSFLLSTRPYQIVPFFIAPVLPGETMKRLQFQARVVTDPIKHPLIGWWKEYYFFYVKHRDLDAFNDETGLQSMMLQPDFDTSTLSIASSTANAATFFAGSAGALNFVRGCLDVCVSAFFRDEGESSSIPSLDTMPLAAAFPRKANWMDSLTLDDDMPDIDPNDTSAQAAEPQYRMWQYMRSMQLINMSYEEWLRTWGVNTPKNEMNEPELIRYVRQWQYPSNTIDPTTGTPTSAVSWSVQERADKNRFFKEPGFLFGVTVTRPKVYAKNQKGSLSSFMNNAVRWLPPMLTGDPALSLIQFAEGAGPLQVALDGTTGYWVDLRDYLLYGEHFTNLDLSAATDKSTVTLPTADGGFKYPTESDIDDLFVGSTDPVRTVREDGVVSLAILGSQVDNT